MDNKYSIVHYFSEEEKHKCGYCKKLDTNAIHGMWAQCLTVQDYQDLIDRGWRRSGKYCYKPIMDITCCPMYTIKCEALSFKPSKSQKKIMKRVNKFLNDGIQERDNVSNNSIERQQGGPFEMETTNRQHTDVDLTKIQPNDNIKEITNDQQTESRCKSDNLIEKQIETPAALDSTKIINDYCSDTIPDETEPLVDPETKSSSYKPVYLTLSNTFYIWIESFFQFNITDTLSIWVESFFISDLFRTFWDGVDNSKPPCKKAKLMRMERKKQKLAAAGMDLDVVLMSKYQKQQEEKTLEEFIIGVPNNAMHKLKITLVRTAPESEEWKRSSKKAYDIYVKYQMAVHRDSPDKCSERQFRRFLVESPLQAVYPREGPSHGYGSFHQQYWLGENLIAVGVIDILPKCVSSVYFFYDPDYSHLSLGTYGSLREIHFTRELHRIASELKYYYMGYYIHSCPKMRYKANFSPSYLLCPETYYWFPIEKCLEMLNIHSYARFNENSESTDENRCSMEDIKNVLILYNCAVMRYFHYRQQNRHVDDEIHEYANLVGRKCAFRMFLVRDS